MSETSLEAPVDLCVEIGPGLGTLTSSLLRRFDKVLAIEFDTRLAENLPKSFPGKNLEVVNADVLEFDFEKIPQPYVVAGNIPYYITTPIIKKLLNLQNKPEKIVLLVQKEVAEKICDSTSHSSLSLFVDNSAKSSLGVVVPRALFTPPPKVDSKVLILEPRKSPQTSPEILTFIQNCFKNPRKKLVANLLAISSASKSDLETVLKNLGFSLNARPSDLSLDDYANLAKILKQR